MIKILPDGTIEVWEVDKIAEGCYKKRRPIIKKRIESEKTILEEYDKWMNGKN